MKYKIKKEKLAKRHGGYILYNAYNLQGEFVVCARTLKILKSKLAEIDNRFQEFENSCYQLNKRAEIIGFSLASSR